MRGRHHGICWCFYSSSYTCSGKEFHGIPALPHPHHQANLLFGLNKTTVGYFVDRRQRKGRTDGKVGRMSSLLSPCMVALGSPFYPCGKQGSPVAWLSTPRPSKAPAAREQASAPSFPLVKKGPFPPSPLKSLPRWLPTAPCCLCARIVPQTQASCAVRRVREVLPVLMRSSRVAGGERAGRTGPQRVQEQTCALHAVPGTFV